MTSDTSTTSVLINLAILVAVVAVGWPLMSRLRRRISRDRRARWAREDAAYREQVEGDDRGPGAG